jgi:GTP-binding protein
MSPALIPIAPTYSDEELAAARQLFAQECTFLLGVANLVQLPEPGLPEVALIGRSNVGKSSLLNALTGRKTLARVSNTPGRTQQINFFDLGRRLMLVDLPGYGFAQAPHGMVVAWTRMIRAYLRGRVSLRRVGLLVDGRHGLKKTDLDMMKMLDTAAVPYRVVLTKIDKIGARALVDTVAKVEKGLIKHPAAAPKVLPTSSETGAGIAELRADLAGLAEAAPA